MNLDKALDKAYKGKTLKERVAAPIATLQGVTADEAAMLGKAFNVKTHW